MRVSGPTLQRVTGGGCLTCKAKHGVVSYEDTNEENRTYNSDAEPLTYTNADGDTASYTYSSGNLAVVEDALTDLTTTMGKEDTDRFDGERASRIRLSPPDSSRRQPRRRASELLVRSEQTVVAFEFFSQYS